ncbi:hypothetical protein EE612_058717 [Oryza sativa]|nr:hypothetical protein EE612_058717 [Oryza sativa]
MREMSTLSHQHHHVLVLQLILLLPFLPPRCPRNASRRPQVLRRVGERPQRERRRRARLPGGSFTLGFFAATRRRYLGIWFSVSPDAAVHWVANRDHALNDTSGALMLTDAGVLLLPRRLRQGGVVLFRHRAAFRDYLRARRCSIPATWWCKGRAPAPPCGSRSTTPPTPCCPA